MNTKPNPIPNDQDVSHPNNSISGDEQTWPGIFEDKADFDGGHYFKNTGGTGYSIAVCDPGTDTPRVVDQSELAILLANNELLATYRLFQKIIFEFNTLDTVESESTKRSGLDKSDRLAEANKVLAGATSEEINGIVALAKLLIASKLPEVAPELYVDRPNKKETAPEFVKRVYNDYLDGRLTMAVIGRLDPKLRLGLNNWRSRQADKKFPSWLNLPTKAETNDGLVARLPIHFEEEICRLSAAITRRR